MQYLRWGRYWTCKTSRSVCGWGGFIGNRHLGSGKGAASQLHSLFLFQSFRLPKSTEANLRRVLLTMVFEYSTFVHLTCQFVQRDRTRKEWRVVGIGFQPGIDPSKMCPRFSHHYQLTLNHKGLMMKDFWNI